MDDPCPEHHSEYFQLTLSTPGAAAMVGESYRVLIRIDDDDLENDEGLCSYDALFDDLL